MPFCSAGKSQYVDFSADAFVRADAPIASSEKLWTSESHRRMNRESVEGNVIEAVAGVVVEAVSTAAILVVCGLLFLRGGFALRRLATSTMTLAKRYDELPACDGIGRMRTVLMGSEQYLIQLEDDR